MAKTVTCLYTSDAEASSVIRELEDAGISQGKICLFTQSGQDRFWDGASSFDDDASVTGEDRVARYLTSNGVPGDDAHAYAEGVRRGHALVAVRCDDDEVSRVVDILDNDDVLDLDERQEDWRSEGWTGSGAGDMHGASMTTSAGMLGGTEISDRDTTHNRSRDIADGRDEVIPVAEEELHVGKREVSHGRVRIRSHVIERPVQEQVSLTEERVAVERRPVEGTMHGSTRRDNGDLFRERTIEMEERAEEAVVSKQARVVEEVVVRKEADQRTETISDTVRKTEVEVDDERGSSTSKTGTTDTNR